MKDTPGTTEPREVNPVTAGRVGSHRSVQGLPWQPDRRASSGDAGTRGRPSCERSRDVTRTIPQTGRAENPRTTHGHVLRTRQGSEQDVQNETRRRAGGVAGADALGSVLMRLKHFRVSPSGPPDGHRAAVSQVTTEGTREVAEPLPRARGLRRPGLCQSALKAEPGAAVIVDVLVGR